MSLEKKYYPFTNTVPHRHLPVPLTLNNLTKGVNQFIAKISLTASPPLMFKPGRDGPSFFTIRFTLLIKPMYNFFMRALMIAGYPATCLYFNETQTTSLDQVFPYHTGNYNNFTVTKTLGYVSLSLQRNLIPSPFELEHWLKKKRLLN